MVHQQAVLCEMSSTVPIITHNRWTGREGPSAWLTHSPDLNPMDFYLWGHLKALVYSAPVLNVKTLHQRIVNACRTIQNYPRTFERLRHSMIRRGQACINLILQARPFSAVTRKGSVCGHIFILTCFLDFVRGAHLRSLSACFRHILYRLYWNLRRITERYIAAPHNLSRRHCTWLLLLLFGKWLRTLI
jgi:hypothetical protein